MKINQDFVMAVETILFLKKRKKDDYLQASEIARSLDFSVGYLQKVIQNERMGDAQIATICGRYYAMDRDQRWERTKKAYDLMVNAIGDEYDTVEKAVKSSYDAGVTDEFITPKMIRTRIPPA